jgi:hypothetical protein
MLTILRSDIVAFVERSVRQRFETNEDFANDISDEQLIRLKGAIGKTGDATADEICTELSGNMDFWFGPKVPQGEGKTFDAHEALMTVLQKTARATEKLLGDNGFPEDDGGGYSLSYNTPRRFVNGKYAPGLAEKFWKYLSQLNDVRDQRHKRDAGEVKASLRQRWDSVLPDKD